MYDVSFIENLRNYIFEKTGKSYFKNIRDGRDDILVTCPHHKEGQERHPSCGFSKKDKDNITAGFFHCFNCGFTGDTHTVLKEVLGDRYDKEDANKVLGLDDLDFEYRLNANPILFTLPSIEPVKYISRTELKQYRYYHDYLKNRNISLKTADKFDIGYDIRTDEITFPIKDIYGNCLAVGRRSVQNKRYEYPRGFTKPVYGVYELPNLMSNLYVYIVEGPFNLWSLNEYGKNGVALLGTGTKTQLEQLLTIRCKGFVLALDGDSAGRKGNMKIAKFLLRYKKEVFVACVPDFEDINSMTPQMFSQMEIKDYKEWSEFIHNRFAEDIVITDDVMYEDYYE